MGDSAGMKITLQTRGGRLVVLEKGRIAVYGSVVTFSDDKVGAVCIEVFVKFGAMRALDTVVRPQNLRSIRHVYHAHRGFVMAGGKG
jgi:hypothetical protein